MLGICSPHQTESLGPGERGQTPAVARSSFHPLLTTAMLMVTYTDIILSPLELQYAMTAETTDMQLEELIGLDANVELQFSDGLLACNGTVLSVFSSVLRGAVEAHTAGSNTSKGDSPRCTIPIEGLTREEWLQVAGFLYPVAPATDIRDLQQAEFLLEAGKKYGLSLVMDKVDTFLAGSSNYMVAAAHRPSHIWK